MKLLVCRYSLRVRLLCRMCVCRVSVPVSRTSLPARLDPGWTDPLVSPPAFSPSQHADNSQSFVFFDDGKRC